jgi:hypothetical protein
MSNSKSLTLADLRREALKEHEKFKSGEKPMIEKGDPVLDAAYCTAYYSGSDANMVRLSKTVPDTDDEMGECGNDPTSIIYADCCRKVLYRYLTDYLDSVLPA